MTGPSEIKKSNMKKKILLISESLMGGTGSRQCQDMKKSARLCATSQLKAGQNNVGTWLVSGL